MRIEAVDLVSTSNISGDFTASRTGLPLFMGHVDRFSIVTSNTNATGSFKIQVSNDPALDPLRVSATSWVDLPSAAIAMAGTAIQTYQATDFAYRWARVVFTFTSGAGVLNYAQLATKGV